jgi:hypothetical protein
LWNSRRDTANKADLFANIPSLVRPTFGAPPHKSHLDELGGFIQDDWRAHARLVLNLGLRYDYYPTVKLVPTTDIPVQIVNLTPASDLRKMDFGAPLDPLRPYEPDGWVNLGPRAGFAWTIDGARDTVLRGGVGVLYSPQMPAVVRTFMAEVGYVRVDGRKFLQQRLFSLAMDRETGARPNQALGAPGGYYVDNSQTSEYNALQTSLRKRFATHFSFDVHYTLSKGTATQGGDVGAYYQGDFEDFTRDFLIPRPIAGRRCRTRGTA